MKVKDLVYITIFTSIICVLSLITIPATVPFTLQTLAIFITIYMLKPKNSLIAVLLYVLIGAIGLPVFSSFNSGFGALAGPTGGYILGFILMPLCGFVLKNKTITCIVGLAICYLVGSIWFLVFNTSGINNIWKVLTICVIPFIIPDALKLVLAWFLHKRLIFLAQDLPVNKEEENDEENSTI